MKWSLHQGSNDVRNKVDEVAESRSEAVSFLTKSQLLPDEVSDEVNFFGSNSRPAGEKEDLGRSTTHRDPLSEMEPSPRVESSSK